MGAQNFCYPGIIENFSLACGASHPIFTPAARCAAVLFVAFCWLCASDTPQFVPLRWLAALRYPIFPQAQRDGVFFVAFRAPLFPRPLCGRIFRNDSRSKHTPVYPTSKLAALSPPPRPLLIIYRPRAFFSPKQNAACSLGISPLYNPTLPMHMVWPCFAESSVSYLFF